MSQIIRDEKLIDEALSRGVDVVYPSKEMLKKDLASGRRLKIFLGIDPTAKHLHFGHAEQLLALKRFQNLGHEIILLIGDFTAMIGDPTDKLSARQPLTEQEVKENLRTFREQAGKILRIGAFGGAKVRFNSEWFKKMPFEKVMELAQHFTVQQMIERDMFQERLKAGKPIGVHEFFYPMMQGYDSVMLDVDMEIGGTDQTFNMLAGRTLRKIYQNKEKFVFAMKLMVNPETGKKMMSKSEGNTVNLDDSVEDIFGKVMAMEDATMFVLAELSTEMPLLRIAQLKDRVRDGMNPRDAKIEIAMSAVALIYGAKEAEKAKERFIKLFSKKEIPQDIPSLDVPMETIGIIDLVVLSGVAKSKGEARRLVEQGGVHIDEKQEKDPSMILELRDGAVVKIGKHHFFRIKKQ